MALFQINKCEKKANKYTAGQYLEHSREGENLEHKHNRCVYSYKVTKSLEKNLKKSKSEKDKDYDEERNIESNQITEKNDAILKRLAVTPLETIRFSSMKTQCIK